MRISRTVCFPPIVLLCFVPVIIAAELGTSVWRKQSASAAAYTAYKVAHNKPGLPPSDKGIKEVIADKYRKRYQEWKSEFLSTETGRAEWEAYERNDRFVLTITISDDNLRGAGTSKYKWNESGELIAATITLGGRISEGYPNPVYYPVMNSLAPGNSSYTASGPILAATKIAHEFGHVKRMAKTNPEVYRLQSQLVPLYNSILLNNGRDASDPRLVELAEKMGGTPVEIWEDREYWGEVNAMVFLRDKIAQQNYQCSLFNKIREFVELYAMPYRERFAEVAESRSVPHGCSW